jgi:hypothetical protein
VQGVGSHLADRSAPLPSDGLDEVELVLMNPVPRVKACRRDFTEEGAILRRKPLVYADDVELPEPLQRSNDRANAIGVLATNDRPHV